MYQGQTEFADCRHSMPLWPARHRRLRLECPQNKARVNFVADPSELLQRFSLQNALRGYFICNEYGRR